MLLKMIPWSNRLAIIPIALLVILSVLPFSLRAQSSVESNSHNQLVIAEIVDIDTVFLNLLLGNSEEVLGDLRLIDSAWDTSLLPMALEVVVYSRNRSVVEGLVAIMQEKTGQTFGMDIDAWYRWIWTQPEQRHTHYARFKSQLYKNIDPRFEQYFGDERATQIRLDEIRWGGVAQDGIPPLRQPQMIAAVDASYLADTDIVFGIAQGSDVRAYPKRILAWHEMFVDEVDNTRYAGVYCTLCGMVILYETSFNGVQHAVGTSGFLYRSNKLMYDKATQSLWSTTRGEPVVGPLVGKGIHLKHSFVVTTTWGEWKRRHPQTQVLSINTGYQRNYGEGVAYQRYFATDELMFTVPETDERLANKAEILALRFPAITDKTVAISADYLSRNTVYHHQVGPQKLVILTDPSGANRVFDAGNTRFTHYDGDRTATDSNGKQWKLLEAALKNDSGQVLKRLPAHRAFWFGWRAVYTDTELVM